MSEPKRMVMSRVSILIIVSLGLNSRAWAVWVSWPKLLANVCTELQLCLA